MEEPLNKSIRNGLYVWGTFILLSLSWGIYDFATGAWPFNLANVLWTIAGSTISTVIFFVVTFAISLTYYYFKDKKN